MQRLQQQAGEHAVLRALQCRLGFFAGGEDGHAFADHAALAAQGAHFAGRTAFAAVEDDHFVFDPRGFVRPVENVADADAVLGVAVILRDQHAFVSVGVETAMTGEIQQSDVAVAGKQLADLVFEFLPAQVILGGRQYQILEVGVAIGVGFQYRGHGHGVVATAAEPANMRVIVDADEQCLAHGYTTVSRLNALTILWG